MTDAERIAEYLAAHHIQQKPFTEADVVKLAAINRDGWCGTLLAMLSDVRREEREAALRAVDWELRFTTNGTIERQRLTNVRRDIAEGGHK